MHRAAGQLASRRLGSNPEVIQKWAVGDGCDAPFLEGPRVTPPAFPAHVKPMLLRSFGSEQAQPAVSRGRPGPLGADHVCATFLDAEVRDVA